MDTVTVAIDVPLEDMSLETERYEENLIMWSLRIDTNMIERSIST